MWTKSCVMGDWTELIGRQRVSGQENRLSTRKGKNWMLFKHWEGIKFRIPKSHLFARSLEQWSVNVICSPLIEDSVWLPYFCYFRDRIHGLLWLIVEKGCGKPPPGLRDWRLSYPHVAAIAYELLRRIDSGKLHFIQLIKRVEENWR